MSAKTVEYDLLDVAFSALDTTASGTGGNMPFNVVVTDSHNAFSGGIYTVPVAGYYSILAEAWINGNSAPAVILTKNGTQVRASILNRVANDSISGGIVSATLYCNVGDQLAVVVTGGFTLSNVSNNYFNINRV